MTYKQILFAGAALAGTIAAVPAQAAPILFELSGSRNATFTLDTDTTPDFFSSGTFGDQISFDGVSGIFGGTPGLASVGFGTGLFATLNIGGTPLGFTQFAGPDLLTIVNTKPVFNFGTFNLTSIVSGSSTITISAATAAIPEPATWAMMLAGFGAIGFAMRRKQAVRVTFA
ncbi:PEPxxWA-CTERM sorting domain-containing protein [Sphingobium subterraneum]|uniref:Ice-binding protein C-terminal domain-containing protein n=1 Tax=Sphingobium subterraneum TaxID=627688 RepID=A0A841J472_9SPHN|nr:PEPxxWA-CTERM sorting domain-containing protein [Sphingobium subterraneum]MBB6124316.1 hypothetical protein [Sphingobium subterraneum]